jgi:hypothetical protein
MPARQRIGESLGAGNAKDWDVPVTDELGYGTVQIHHGNPSSAAQSSG